MKLTPLAALALLSTAPLASASDRINIAEDEASHSAYGGGWDEGKNAGTGFGAWVLVKQGGNREDSHAGFFVAQKGNQPDLENVAIGEKAFGMFANGVDYEAACAFRTLDSPLAIGDSFSLMMETSEFVRKFASDDLRPGVIGFALRTGSASGSPDDTQAGARLQFGAYEGDGTYQVYDGESSPDTGVPTSTGGVAVSVTLVSADTYDLEITVLDTKETTKLAGRKLAGEAGTPIESFAVYNQDGETGDAYFNGFQVSRSSDKLTR